MNEIEAMELTEDTFTCSYSDLHKYVEMSRVATRAKAEQYAWGAILCHFEANDPLAFIVMHVKAYIDTERYERRLNQVSSVKRQNTQAIKIYQDFLSVAEG